MPQESGEKTQSRILSALDRSLRGFVERYGDTLLAGMEPRIEDAAAPDEIPAPGRFLLQGRSYHPVAEACGRAVAELLELLRQSLPNLEPEVRRLAHLFESEQIDAARFLVLVLSNQGNTLIQLCRQFQLREDLLILFAVFLARSYRSKAAGNLAGRIDLGAWDRGYCPVCGHWPSLAHIDDGQGKRTLWCLQCTTVWPYPRLRCVFCFHEDQEQLEILHPEADPKLRVQACKLCRRYIKEVRTEEPPASFLFDAVYLGTGPLDLIAINAGYFQESALAVRFSGTDGLRADQAE